MRTWDPSRDGDNVLFRTKDGDEVVSACRCITLGKDA